MEWLKIEIFVFFVNLYGGVLVVSYSFDNGVLGKYTGRFGRFRVGL